MQKLMLLKTGDRPSEFRLAVALARPVEIVVTGLQVW
jgi:hypothetical protein